MFYIDILKLINIHIEKSLLDIFEEKKHPNNECRRIKIRQEKCINMDVISHKVFDATS